MDLGACDLEQLRQLVGDRQLSYWAVSYGTFLGQTHANLFPGVAGGSQR